MESDKFDTQVDNEKQVIISDEAIADIALEATLLDWSFESLSTPGWFSLKRGDKGIDGISVTFRAYSDDELRAETKKHMQGSLLGSPNYF